jgi:hypothetical protein
MNEHPLLGMLAELTGSFLFANTPSFEQLKNFQTTVASALLQNQDPSEIRRTFGFEKIENAAVQALDQNDLLYLNSILYDLEQHPVPSLERVRIFRREVPSCQARLKVRFRLGREVPGLMQRLDPYSIKMEGRSGLIYTK